MGVKIHKLGKAEVYEVSGHDLEMLSEEEVAALEEPLYEPEILREIVGLKPSEE